MTASIKYRIYKKRLFLKDKIISNYTSKEIAEDDLEILRNHYTFNLIFGFPYYIKPNIANNENVRT